MMLLCQGNGCATQLWSIIISIVLSALRTQGFRIHFVNSFTTKIAQLVGFSYVDDCDLIHSDDYEGSHPLTNTIRNVRMERTNKNHKKFSWHQIKSHVP